MVKTDAKLLNTCYFEYYKIINLGVDKMKKSILAVLVISIFLLAACSQQAQDSKEQVQETQGS